MGNKMGWDAYAYRSVEDFMLNLDSHDPKPHLDSEMRIVFEEANAILKKLTGDGGEIINGQLGGSLSKKCLTLATPVSCEPNNQRGVLFWSPETVQKANALANWHYVIEDKTEDFDRVWYEYIKCETRIFLQVCSHRGYAIVFSG